MYVGGSCMGVDDEGDAFVAVIESLPDPIIIPAFEVDALPDEPFDFGLVFPVIETPVVAGVTGAEVPGEDKRVDKSTNVRDRGC